MEKWEKREKKKNKKRHGMQVSNRSIFTIKQEVEKKSRDAKKNKEQERQFFMENVK